MEITSIIIKPKITEKAQIMRSMKDPKMAFIVNMHANKYQVSVAFHALFGIRPKSVNILIRKPVPTRYMNKSRYNYTKYSKVAYVTVSSKDFDELQKKSSEMFSGQGEETSTSE